MVKKQDEIYASPLNEIIDFDFDEKVAEVFPDMIQRSLPGYGTMISSIGVLAAKYAQANSHCYDLGCSLGAASLAMQQSITAMGCRIVGIDNSEAMLEKFSTLLLSIDNYDNLSKKCPIELVHSDLQDCTMKNASIVVLNFTLQFIPLDQRDTLIQRIFNSLLPGGVLIVSEKVCFEDETHQALMTELHHNFKRTNGYSELEIAQKRSAIENFLIPETLKAHRDRFKAAGFTSQDVWFQCFNFASMLAIK